MYKPLSKEVEAKVSCKYALSSIVAKRARALVDFKECNEDFKPVLQALDEFEEGTIVPGKE
jgi:DNA-directed RNA polymerase subunit K/omega